MSDPSRRVKTQWNHYVRPFDSFSDKEIRDLLGFCSETTQVAEKLCGKQCFLVYGALLGFEREGKLIPHDFDIDVAINCGVSTKDEVAEICRKLMIGFLDAGYEVKAKCFAQFFVLPPKESKTRYKVEIFASWIEEEMFYLYFALDGIDIVDSIFPLKNIELGGHHFYAPKSPSALLCATYGDDWRVPNPEFRYDMSAGKWAPFTSFFFSRNKKQWDEHYSQNGIEHDVSQKEDKDLSYVLDLPKNKHLKILDVGCGAAEISVGYAIRGHSVTAIDTSQVVVDKLNTFVEEQDSLSLTSKVINLYDIPACENYSLENCRKFDMIVANNLVNYISPVGESTFFRMAAALISEHGEIHVLLPSDSIVKNEAEAIAVEPSKPARIALYSRTICLEKLEKIAWEFNLGLVQTTRKGNQSQVHLTFILNSENQLFGVG